MIWRVFKRAPGVSAASAAWWRTAAAAEREPQGNALNDLRAALAGADADPDERERQVEMLEGLEQLAAIAARDLDVIQTQHRVIGTDVCHFVAPACLVGLTDEPGKLFLTSRRLIHVCAKVRTWPWHRLGGVERAERALEITILGAPDTINVTCNTYGDAMAAAHLVRRLQR